MAKTRMPGNAEVESEIERLAESGTKAHYASRRQLEVAVGSTLHSRVGLMPNISGRVTRQRGRALRALDSFLRTLQCQSPGLT